MRCAATSRGFTYVGLLILVALAGAVLAAAGTLWSTDSRREREKELLFAGDQFRRAIAAYYAEAPAGQPHRFPAKLDDLLNDKRWPTTKRYLRRVFVDPMTGTRDWVLVRGADQGIIGVHSASEDVPIKRALFGDDYARFESAKTYRDWQFIVAVNTTRPANNLGKPSAPAGPASAPSGAPPAPRPERGAPTE